MELASDAVMRGGDINCDHKNRSDILIQILGRIPATAAEMEHYMVGVIEFYFSDSIENRILKQSIG